EVPLDLIGFASPINADQLLLSKSLQWGRIVIGANHRNLDFYFDIGQRNPITGTAQRRQFRYRLPIAQLTHILRIPVRDGHVYALPLQSPPICHRKLQNPVSTFSDNDLKWDSKDAWFRQTDITDNPRALASMPLTLHKPRAIIDIGRCTTILFNATKPQTAPKLAELLTLLGELNIVTQNAPGMEVVTAAPADAWRWLYPPQAEAPSAPSSSLSDLVSSSYNPLSFAVRYQLEVCLSHGYLSAYTIGEEFVRRLASLPERDATGRLEHVALNKMSLRDPMELFALEGAVGLRHSNVPKHCCRMRTARITPTTVYYNTPSVETSNRVVRYFMEHADRFLRVRFTDERLEGRLMSSYNNTMDEVFTRVKRTLKNGIQIGNRHYEFLAFGNSQFREHGAYFFAGVPNANVNASTIRAWMGELGSIRNVAKHAARLGQCFSTTLAVKGTPVQAVRIPDIDRNLFNFSDGVGRISPFLAQMIKAEFGIKPDSAPPPSVYQFRYGGCKGILTVCQEARGQEVHIRDSQHKFDAPQNGLEVIRYSQFSAAALNRQLIIVLSALGVSDSVFLQKLRLMLKQLENAMTDMNAALALLTKYVDPNEATLFLASLVSCGFQTTCEPFVTSLLKLWRSWQIKYLKEKAKIVIERGACLLGCLDETATLRGYFNATPSDDVTDEEKIAHLPEVFVQVSRHDTGRYEVVEGLCILARNPSLHPGDIRVVRAVDCPPLHHLKDVVVLPQTGDRDVASMCSGGDLDGDEYVIIWDPDLLPGKWFEEPMDYGAIKGEVLDRDVTVDDITSFFVTYMKNDHLPQIAHAHLALADFLDDGVYDARCKQLAELHSAAVDYNKTGIPAQMPRKLRPRRWPHFMEKRFKSADQTYHSRKILGQLYDAVDRVEFEPLAQGTFDGRILDSGIAVSGALLEKASQMKERYDLEMRRIMTQHQIETEFEVFSTFVLSHANLSNDFKFHEELGRISTNLRARFHDCCVELAGGKDHWSLAPLAVAMYRVTADEYAAHQQQSNGGMPVTVAGRAPFISFPWVLYATLCEIATGRLARSKRPASLQRSSLAAAAVPGDMPMPPALVTAPVTVTAIPDGHATDVMQPHDLQDARRAGDHDSWFTSDRATDRLPTIGDDATVSDATQRGTDTELSSKESSLSGVMPPSDDDEELLENVAAPQTTMSKLALLSGFA
ncbi:hypothetical protein KEM52_000963, partial [Ascosphaera acerosa]